MALTQSLGRVVQRLLYLLGAFGYQILIALQIWLPNLACLNLLGILELLDLLLRYGTLLLLFCQEFLLHLFGLKLVRIVNKSVRAYNI